MSAATQNGSPQPATKSNGLPLNFFTDLGNADPWVKGALEGFGGSGKSWTEALIAIGLWLLLRERKQIGPDEPIMMVETESAGKFLKPLFDRHGIKVNARPTRSLADLKLLMKAMRDGYGCILLIDSIFHIYDGFVRAYLAKKNKTRIDMPDWGYIKPTWREAFSDRFVSDPYHILFTGRAGHEYDTEVDEETNKRSTFKSGIKMRGVGEELEFEPHLVVFMEKIDDVLGKEKSIIQRATILKDRSGLIHGKSFDNPTFETFLPAIQFALGDAVMRDVAPPLENSILIKTEDERREWMREKDTALEKIDGLLLRALPGNTGKDKQLKLDILDQAFGTTSETELKGKPIEELREGYKRIVAILIARGLAEWNEQDRRLEVKAIPTVDMTPHPPVVVRERMVELDGVQPRS